MTDEKSGQTLDVEIAPGQATSGVLYRANAVNRLHTTLVLGHGAGGNQHARFIVDAATCFASLGVDVVTFNFLYTERRKRVPDRPDVLEACYRAVMDRAVSLDGLAGNRLFTAGKSLGGRIASMVAAKLPRGEVTELAGLIFFGYPLHPPGQPDKLRIQHLPDVRVPMLLLQGTRDSFGGPSEVREALLSLTPAPTATIHEVVGGDHSLAVRRGQAGGDTIETLVQNVALPWMTELTSRVAPPER